MVEFLLASPDAEDNGKDQKTTVYNFVGILLNANRLHILL